MQSGKKKKKTFTQRLIEGNWTVDQNGVVFHNNNNNNIGNQNMIQQQPQPQSQEQPQIQPEVEDIKWYPVNLDYDVYIYINDEIFIIDKLKCENSPSAVSKTIITILSDLGYNNINMKEWTFHWNSQDINDPQQQTIITNDSNIITECDMTPGSVIWKHCKQFILKKQPKIAEHAKHESDQKEESESTGGISKNVLSTMVGLFALNMFQNVMGNMELNNFDLNTFQNAMNNMNGNNSVQLQSYSGTHNSNNNTERIRYHPYKMNENDKNNYKNTNNPPH
eukprot:209929_1